MFVFPILKTRIIFTPFLSRVQKSRVQGNRRFSLWTLGH
jgi:hypothetical protein